MFIFSVPYRGVITNQITIICFYPDRFSILPDDTSIDLFDQFAREVTQSCSNNVIDIVSQKFLHIGGAYHCCIGNYSKLFHRLLLNKLIHHWQYSMPFKNIHGKDAISYWETFLCNQQGN